MVSRLRLGLLCAVAVAVFSLFASTGSAAAAGTTIKGKVVEAGGSVGIEGVEVCAYQLPEYEPFFCEETDANGEYTLSAIPNGKYVVEFWASYLGYAPQFYNGSPNTAGADEVVVNESAVSGIDAELEEGGEIEGRVTDALTGAGIKEAEVCAFAFGVGGACTLTDTAGDYGLIGLGTGSYFVEFLAQSFGYEPLFYNQQPNFESANQVGLVAPNTVGGVNARMSKPAAPHITPPPVVIPTLPSIPTPKPTHKALTCHKGYKKIKRHGRSVCVKKHKHKKKHHS